MVTVILHMRPIPNKARRLPIAALIGVTIGSLVAPILVAEGALHIQSRPQPDPHEADAIARGSASTWEPARTPAADGVVLDAWLFTPHQPNGSGVLVLHGVGDTGIPRKVIAETIAGKLGIEAKSITDEQAPQYLGFLAPFAGLDNPTSNDRTRALLGWEPTHPGWIEDVQAGHYFA